VKDRIVAAVDAWQRGHAIAGFAFAVIKKFGDDRASSLAALMAYYAFFSLFPLLLVFVSVLGFVLQDDPSLREDIVDSTLSRIPVVGAQLGAGVEPLQGSSIALVVGIVGALWAGLGVTLALGRAFQDIHDVPRLEQRGPVRSRVRGVTMLVLLGVALIAASVLSGLATGGPFGDVAGRLGALAAALLANLLIFLAVFWLQTPRPRTARGVLPGVAVAAIGSLVLQSLGGWYVDATIAGATDTYGAFALVIGLMSWFLLGSNMLLIAAEVNVVRARRLWPRALAGELAEADRRALRANAESARQDERQEIVVGFGDG